jgi:hypothetical protein
MIKFIIESNLDWGRHMEVKKSEVLIGRITFHNDEYEYTKVEWDLLENSPVIEKDLASLKRRIRSEEEGCNG